MGEEVAIGRLRIGANREEISMRERLPGDGWIARPFGRDMLYTKRMEKVPVEDLVPNSDQPREGRWESDELKREIEDAERVVAAREGTHCSQTRGGRGHHRSSRNPWHQHQGAW